MALIVPDASLGYFLEKILNEDLTLHLYQNEVTISGASVAGDFLEANFTGYAATTLTNANWGVVDGNPATATFDTEQEFTSTADSQNQDIYGYYVTYTGGTEIGNLAWAEAFPAPQNIDATGDKIRITPIITEARV